MISACLHDGERQFNMRFGEICSACGATLRGPECLDAWVTETIYDQERRAVWAAFVWLAALVRTLAKQDQLWALDAVPIAPQDP